MSASGAIAERPLSGGAPARLDDRSWVQADIEKTAPACEHVCMNRSQAIAATEHFLATVWGDKPPSDEALLSALDWLVAAYHETPHGDVTDAQIDAPRQDGPSLYKQVAERFPAYGYYPVADPTKSLDDALMTADAIDDLADLTLAMREVLWFAENISIDDAHFAFRLHYFHWGQHARELAVYLCGDSGDECLMLGREPLLKRQVHSHRRGEADPLER